MFLLGEKEAIGGYSTSITSMTWVLKGLLWLLHCKYQEASVEAEISVTRKTMVAGIKGAAAEMVRRGYILKIKPMEFAAT